jgi:hypothetical protein
MWRTIAAEAVAESSLWADALKADLAGEPVFSPLAEERFRLGLETIYEGYLVHYGTARLFEPPDPDSALLLGDYLYAHGLVRIADVGEVDAVAGGGGSTGRGLRFACTATRRRSRPRRGSPPAMSRSTPRSRRTQAECSSDPSPCSSRS